MTSDPARVPQEAQAPDRLVQDLAALDAVLVSGPQLAAVPATDAGRLPEDLVGELAASLRNLDAEGAAPDSIGEAPASGEFVSVDPAAPPPPFLTGRVILPSEPGEPVMRIPSSWLATPEVPARGLIPPALRSGLMGLAVGLAVLLPAMFWFAGKTGNAKPKRLEKAAAPAVEAPLQAASAVAATTLAMPVANASAATAGPDDLVAIARQAIAGGDIFGARQVLAQIELRDVAEAYFTLAETYDPNILAAWGTRGIRADPVAAAALYRKALGGGITEAQGRIEALR